MIYVVILYMTLALFAIYMETEHDNAHYKWVLRTYPRVERVVKAAPLKALHAYAKRKADKSDTMYAWNEGLKSLEAKRKMEDKRRFVKSLENRLTILGDKCYRFISEYGDITIYASPKQLHDVRTGLRKHFSRWNDKVESSGCCGKDVQIKYKGDNSYPYPVFIAVDYPLDDLPKGLLKPGCKVIRETTTSESCRIECEL